MDNCLPKTRLERGKVIGKTLLKLGANHSKGALKKMVTSKSKHHDIHDEVHEECAKIIIEALGELKGVSVKIAQQVVLALPFLPQHYLEQIGKSFNQIPPINRALIRKLIKQELHASPEELFQTFEPTPFGSASLGQVHFATYQNEPLAIKVQYPGIANTISTDMGMVKFMLERFAKGNNVDHLIEEINQRLYEEVDYGCEAKNITFFHENLIHSHIIIPAFYPEFSSSKVLTCSYLKGLSFHDFLASNPTQIEKNHYAQTLFDTFFISLYHLKAIHADPNPGNFIFMENGMLGMIDFGCIKQVNHTFLKEYNHLHLSLIEGADEDDIINQYAHLGMIDYDDMAKMRAFYHEIIQPLDSLYIEILKNASYDFGKEHSFSKRGFKTILDVQQKKTHSVHKFNHEYLFLNRTLLGYYTIFEQLNARITTQFAKNIMKTFQGDQHDSVH